MEFLGVLMWFLCGLCGISSGFGVVFEAFLGVLLWLWKTFYGFCGFGIWKAFLEDFG